MAPGKEEQLSIKINNIDDFNKYIPKLPAAAIADIDKRISDWLAAGGKETDPYIKQQYRYVENLLNMRWDK